MTLRPREEENIFDRLEERLTDPEQFPGTALQRLTNFLDGSFNRAWVSAFAAGLRENEVRATAAQLSGWIDYAGGPVTQSDLGELGVENVTAEEINEHLDDQDLDELVEIVGIQRRQGTRAVTTLRIFSRDDSDVVVPEGTPFGTDPDARGNFLRFVTTEQIVIPADPDEDNDKEGEDIRGTWKEVEAEAVEVGERYNVPEGSIGYMPDPPSGVDAVTNINQAVGGEDRESNEELRERAKEEAVSSSDGGTLGGIGTFLRELSDAGEVNVEDFPDGNNPDRVDVQYPHTDVIVAGGTGNEGATDHIDIKDLRPVDEVRERIQTTRREQDELLYDVDEAIELSRPSGIRHFLVRPNNISVGVDALVVGDGINTERVSDRITRQFSGTGIDDNIFQDRTIQTILNADESIKFIDEISLIIQDEAFLPPAESEEFTFTNDDDEYELSVDLEDLLVVDSLYSDGDLIDRDLWEVDGTTVSWVGGEGPGLADGDKVEIRYIQITDEEETTIFQESHDTYEIPPFDSISDTIEDEDGNTYTKDTDYEVEENVGITWIGDTPDDLTRFTVNYQRKNNEYRFEKYQDLCTDEGLAPCSVNAVEGTRELEEDVDIELIENGIRTLEGANVGNFTISLSYKIAQDVTITNRERGVAGEMEVEVK